MLTIFAKNYTIVMLHRVFARGICWLDDNWKKEQQNFQADS